MEETLKSHQHFETAKFGLFMASAPFAHIWRGLPTPAAKHKGGLWMLCRSPKQIGRSL